MMEMKAEAMLMVMVSMVARGLSATGPSTASPAALPCEHPSPHAQPSDGQYRLGVAGDPDLFLPGELYTVSLQGVDSGRGPKPFIGFTIWVEMSRSTSKSGKSEEPKPTGSNQSLGTFQAYDAQAKIQDVCTPSVANATGHPKTEIQVIWTAPSLSSGECVRLSARVGPTVNGGSTTLARKMCAAPVAPASIARQPPIVEPCCACDEAKYEVTFEGMWSRHTHPREFPPESARAHFGDVIGASHTAQYRVWQEGRVASLGLRRLADDGATTALEKELKAESDHIRTIIKARGISWQQVASASSPSTFAVFRVDAKHHLVSLAAKLAPSPDWIVGVSALELCTVNCTWTTSLTLPLYPYDAGTDNGLGYMSRRAPTMPPGAVRALRPDWPRDVRSPFYSSLGEMRPFARLRLTRLRLYEKSCDAGAENGAEALQVSGGKEGACATHQWSAWGPCSVSCGAGHRVRQRSYAHPARALDTCHVELTQRERCRGLRRDCRAPTEYEPDSSSAAGPCAVSAWSEWSPCSGCGVRARSRHYQQQRAHKRCHTGFRANTVMDQAMPCAAGPCEKPPPRFINATDFDWFFVDVPATAECRVSSWGGWSPCSAQCGRGRRIRTRLYLPGDTRLQTYITKALLAGWNTHFAYLQNIAPPPVNITADPEIETLSLDYMERCQFTLTMQEALCDGDDGACNDTLVPEEVCKLPLSLGHCRAYKERWFFEYSRRSCEPFGFSGCGGNANNFRSQALCRRNCVFRNDFKHYRTTTTTTTTEKPVILRKAVTKKWKPTPSSRDNEVMNDAPSLQEDVDCEAGPWQGWSECVGNCKYALKMNYRVVERREQGAGRPCGRVVKSRACTPARCTLLHLTNTLIKDTYQ